MVELSIQEACNGKSEGMMEPSAFPCGSVFCALLPELPQMGILHFHEHSSDRRRRE